MQNGRHDRDARVPAWADRNGRLSSTGLETARHQGFSQDEEASQDASVGRKNQKHPNKNNTKRRDSQGPGLFTLEELCISKTHSWDVYVAPYKSSLQNWDVNLYCCKGDNNTDNRIKGIFCCCSAHDTNNTDTHTHCDAMGNLWNCISGVNLEKAYEASVFSLKRKKNEVVTFIIVRTLSPKRFTSVFSSFREK